MLHGLMIDNEFFHKKRKCESYSEYENTVDNIVKNYFHIVSTVRLLKQKSANLAGTH